jgi:hypothetical protein
MRTGRSILVAIVVIAGILSNINVPKFMKRASSSGTGSMDAYATPSKPILSPKQTVEPFAFTHKKKTTNHSTLVLLCKKPQTPYPNISLNPRSNTK